MKELGINELVQIEEIYKTILHLEGPKYPLDNLQNLKDAANYIIEKLESYNIKTEVHEFYLEGFKEPFKNVVGYIGNQSKPAILLGSHYDTVRNSPGANDNLSSVALLLETARILVELENPPTVTIAFFTLEEGDPVRNKKIEDTLKQEGYLDDKGRFTSAHIYHFNLDLKQMVLKAQKVKKTTVLNCYQELLGDRENEFDDVQKSYIENLISILIDFENDTTPNISLGSSLYVEKLLKEKKEIKCILNFDGLGWISNEQGTQKPLPIPEGMESFIRLNKTSLGSTVGNFITVIGEKYSKGILDTFLKYCEQPHIDIPHFGLHVPLEYDVVKDNIRDILRSDHAPFWKAGIKGLFITDTANFRSPYYHNGGDTYDRIDYNMLGKLTTVTIETVIEIDKCLD